MFQLTDDYLAAFIDGEGTFGISKSKYNFIFKIEISNNNLEILQIIQNEHGGNIYDRKKKNRKRSYRLIFSGAKAIKLASLLKDKLFIKKQQAEIFSMIEISTSGNGGGQCKYFKEQREMAKTMINELNKRGDIS